MESANLIIGKSERWKCNAIFDSDPNHDLLNLGIINSVGFEDR
jgi:hypothetical protein